MAVNLYSRTDQRSAAQGGFTLIEIIIALIVITLITGMIASSFGPWAKYKAKVDTENQLASIQQALTTAYEDNAAAIDNVSTATITLPGGNIASTAVATSTTFQPLISYSSMSPAAMYRDGYSKPLTVFVSNQLTTTIDNTVLSYHVIAVVSSGQRMGAEKSTFDPNTGILTLDPSETGIVINGLNIQYALYQQTMTKLQNIAKLYSNYYESRYMNDPSRSYGIDYFANTNGGSGAVSSNTSWDQTGCVNNSVMGGSQNITNGCTASNPAGPAGSVAATGLESALGLSSDDVMDAWGNPIYVDNDSASVRSPDNPNAAMQIPPFTALIYANIVGGQTMAVSAAGTFN
ncbi:MAG: prepilin-type N-terminal cleavage/methylation domain-containing protein [Pseudomonadota bacterium]|nr:prepilin-type N-terminal cleavage/methylation domain-containing protein [Pseudomonadota bacterium]